MSLITIITTMIFFCIHHNNGYDCKETLTDLLALGEGGFGKVFKEGSYAIKAMLTKDCADGKLEYDMLEKVYTTFQSIPDSEDAIVALVNKYLKIAEPAAFCPVVESKPYTINTVQYGCYQAVGLLKGIPVSTWKEILADANPEALTKLKEDIPDDFEIQGHLGFGDTAPSGFALVGDQVEVSTARVGRGYWFRTDDFDENNPLWLLQQTEKYSLALTLPESWKIMGFIHGYLINKASIAGFDAEFTLGLYGSKDWKINFMDFGLFKDVTEQLAAIDVDDDLSEATKDIAVDAGVEDLMYCDFDEADFISAWSLATTLATASESEPVVASTIKAQLTSKFATVARKINDAHTKREDRHTKAGNCFDEYKSQETVYWQTLSEKYTDIVVRSICIKKLHIAKVAIVGIPAKEVDYGEMIRPFASHQMYHNYHGARISPHDANMPGSSAKSKHSYDVNAQGSIGIVNPYDNNNYYGYESYDKQHGNGSPYSSAVIVWISILLLFTVVVTSTICGCIGCVGGYFVSNHLQKQIGNGNCEMGIV